MGTHPSFGVHSFSKQIGLKPLLHLLVVLASPALLGIFPVTEPLLFGFRDDYLGHSGFLVWSPSPPIYKSTSWVIPLSSTHMLTPTGLMSIYPLVFKVNYWGPQTEQLGWWNFEPVILCTYIYIQCIYGSRKKMGLPPEKKKRPIIPHLPSPTESHKCSSQDVWWRPEDPWPKGSPRRAAGSLGPHRARDSHSSSASPAIFSDFIEDVMGSSLDFMMVISWEFMGIKPTPNPPYFNDPPMVGWIYCVTNNQWSLVESPRQNPQKLGNTRATQ